MKLLYYFFILLAVLGASLLGVDGYKKGGGYYKGHPKGGNYYKGHNKGYKGHGR